MVFTKHCLDAYNSKLIHKYNFNNSLHLSLVALEMREDGSQF